MKIVGTKWTHTVALTDGDGSPLQTRRKAIEQAKPREQVFVVGILQSVSSREWRVTDDTQELRYGDLGAPARLRTENVYRTTLEILRPGFDTQDLDVLRRMIFQNFRPTEGAWHALRAWLVDPRHHGIAVDVLITGATQCPTILQTGYAIQLGREPVCYPHHEATYAKTPPPEHLPEPARSVETLHEGATSVGTEPDADHSVPARVDGADEPYGNETPTESGGAQGDVPGRPRRHDTWELPEFSDD